jgi:hypothetical protein
VDTYPKCPLLQNDSLLPSVQTVETGAKPDAYVLRELCAKVAVERGAELDKALSELRAALNEHSKSLRKIAAEGVLGEHSRPQRRTP